MEIFSFSTRKRTYNFHAKLSSWLCWEGKQLTLSFDRRLNVAVQANNHFTLCSPNAWTKGVPNYEYQ